MKAVASPPGLQAIAIIMVNGVERKGGDASPSL
jgi:hypothetical protein